MAIISLREYLTLSSTTAYNWSSRGEHTDVGTRLWEATMPGDILPYTLRIEECHPNDEAAAFGEVWDVRVAHVEDRPVSLIESQSYPLVRRLLGSSRVALKELATVRAPQALRCWTHTPFQKSFYTQLFTSLLEHYTLTTTASKYGTLLSYRRD